MRVVLRVAGDALATDVLERSRPMAIRASHPPMAAEQRKSRQVVIEDDVSAPASLVVTRVAVCSLLSAMYVIVAVACMAAGFEIFLVRIAPVAVVAGNPDVPAAERPVGVAVM